MTTTYTLDRVGGVAADYAMKKLSEADFSRQKTEPTDSGQKTTYTVASGDGNLPTTVVINSKLSPNAFNGAGQRSSTIALNSFARASDGVNADKTAAISCALHINVPTSLPVEVDDIRDMIENLFAITYDTLTAKEPDTVRLSKLTLFGVTEII